MEDKDILKERYEKFALTADYNTTASDYQLRELEIDTASEYIHKGCKVLDVGCGLGYAVIQYATRFMADITGLDYAANMIKVANELFIKNKPPVLGTVSFIHGSVTQLPFQDNSFDVITSSRCLMALLDWELQKVALKELHRVLKPGGILVLMEGTFEGLEKLNKVRSDFGLEPISPDGKDRLFTLKFHEDKLLEFCKLLYVHKEKKSFGMYYFLTRVVQPLLVAPEKPSYDHKINAIAKQICTIYPEYMGLGHLVPFVFSKRR